MIFTTMQAAYLAQRMTLPRGSHLIKRFSDGELYIKIEDDVQGKSVWVIGSTAPPADNIIELFLLLDALKGAGASVNLFLTYFGYARQDRATPGESFGAALMARFLTTFELEHTYILHVHSQRIHTYLHFEDKVPLALFCGPAAHCTRIAAPDEGAYHFAHAIAQTCNLEAIMVTKIRPLQEQVQIVSIVDSIRQQTILIVDDIISTGTTILEVAARLKERGALKVYAAATHGIFSGQARELLERSDLIEKIYVTNSIPQDKSAPFKKIEILDIVPFIQETIEHTQGVSQ
jgi:ribose-phosphate pyrophosphokinase